MNITLFNVGNTRVRLNLLTVPVIFLCICFGKTGILLISLAAVTLHELCHVYAAHKLCVKIDTVDILPCGFSAQIPENAATHSDMLYVASAGVLFSLISGTAAVGLMTVFEVKYDILHSFAYTSIILGAANILPVIPLDGGRMFYAALCRFFRERTAKRISVSVGTFFSMLILFVCVWGNIRGYLNYSAVFISLLMLAGTLTQIRKKPDRTKGMLMLSSAVYSGRRIPVCIAAYGKNTDIKKVLSEMDTGKYNVVSVIDENLSVCAELDEGKLLDAYSRGCKTLGEAES